MQLGPRLGPHPRSPSSFHEPEDPSSSCRRRGPGPRSRPGAAQIGQPGRGEQTGQRAGACPPRSGTPVPPCKLPPSHTVFSISLYFGMAEVGGGNPNILVSSSLCWWLGKVTGSSGTTIGGFPTSIQHAPSHRYPACPSQSQRTLRRLPLQPPPELQPLGKGTPGRAISGAHPTKGHRPRKGDSGTLLSAPAAASPTPPPAGQISLPFGQLTSERSRGERGGEGGGGKRERGEKRNLLAYFIVPPSSGSGDGGSSRRRAPASSERHANRGASVASLPGGVPASMPGHMGLARHGQQLSHERR